MPERVARGYASWDPRGFYHYHERPGGPFISKERYLSMLRPSVIGYHGWAGWTQPWAAIAQILGPGVRTGGSLWWKEITPAPVPVAPITPEGNIQWGIEVTAMRPDGTLVKEKIFNPIGKGYDPGFTESRTAQFLWSGEKYGVEAVEEGEELTEVSRTAFTVGWHSTYGIGPLREE